MMTESPPHSELFRDDDMVVRRVAAGDGQRVVVTFDSYTDNRVLDRKGFGESFFRNQGITAIHVIGRDNDWYQHPRMIEALARIAEATRGASRVMTYGTSMGGYAAVRFADLAGAHTALALAPQYSIDPKKAPFERRWAADSTRIRFLPELDGPIVSRAQTIIAYDPTSADRRHVELIERDIAVTHLRAHYAGHSAPALLSEAGLLGYLVDVALNGTLDVRLIERELRSNRRRHAVYFAELATRQPDRRAQLAITLARRAVALRPDQDISLRTLADRLGAVGQFDEAVEVYHRILGTARPVQHLLPFSRLLVSAGRLEEAAALAEEALERMPHTPANLYWAANVLEQAGELERAVVHAEAAAAADPANPVFRKTVALLRSRIAQNARQAARHKVLASVAGDRPWWPRRAGAARQDG